MKPTSQIIKDFPLKMANGAQFGRYPKISVENTYNMIVADNWLVPYAGYKVVQQILPNGEGRGIYSSEKYNHLIFVIDNKVFQMDIFLGVSQIGTLDTNSGDVFIAENNGGQIALCDKQSIYIFDYVNSTFNKITILPSTTTPFQAGYITFIDGYFITVNLLNNEWRISDPNDGTNWPIINSGGGTNVGFIQTKPTDAMGVIRFPGKSNLIFVLGKTVTEPWYDTGAQLFPFQKNTYYNIDYGCINQSTIAAEKDFIAWLGINDKAGPVIMISDGSEVKQLETDGINFRLARLVNPYNSYGFMFRQDGHIFYQLTFPDPRDDLTLVYDFTTQKFFTLTDENMHYHIAKRVAFFNNTYYFISINDGNLYEMSTRYTDYTYADSSLISDDNPLGHYSVEIPRIRLCPNVRLPDSAPFIVNSMTFTVEQGEQRYNTQQRIDVSISNDGGNIFSNYVGYPFNEANVRPNRFVVWNLGYSNDFVPQFRFYGFERFIATDGVVSIYQ